MYSREQYDRQCELSESLAVALGWTQPGGHAWHAPEGWGETCAEEFEFPEFATDCNACAEAEAEIARRGLTEQYAIVLAEVLELDYLRRPVPSLIGLDYKAIGRAITASPEQRVKAMLKVLT